MPSITNAAIDECTELPSAVTLRIPESVATIIRAPAARIAGKLFLIISSRVETLAAFAGAAFLLHMSAMVFSGSSMVLKGSHGSRR
jgi:hypothetical protein